MNLLIKPKSKAECIEYIQWNSEQSLESEGDWKFLHAIQNGKAQLFFEQSWGDGPTIQIIELVDELESRTYPVELEEAFAEYVQNNFHRGYI